MSEVNVGDRVVIRAVRHPSDKRFAGVQGKVEHAFAGGRNFAVRTDGNVLVIATAVELAYSAERPTSHSLTAMERALYARVNHDWRDEASELDRRRLQAAEFAHRTLGTDALLEDLIGLADWILDNPDASPKDIKRYVFNPGGVLPSAHNAETIESMRKSLHESLARSPFFAMTNATDPIPTPEPTPTIPPADLKIKDTDGDAVTFRFNSGRPDTVAFVVASPSGAYLSADDADQIVSFLQDAKSASAGTPINPDESAEVLTREDLNVRGLSVGLDHADDDDVVSLSGDSCLTADDIDTLIDYLRAAKVVHAKRRAERES